MTDGGPPERQPAATSLQPTANAQSNENETNHRGNAMDALSVSKTAPRKKAKTDHSIPSSLRGSAAFHDEESSRPIPLLSGLEPSSSAECLLERLNLQSFSQTLKDNGIGTIRQLVDSSTGSSSSHGIPDVSWFTMRGAALEVVSGTTRKAHANLQSLVPAVPNVAFFEPCLGALPSEVLGLIADYLFLESTLALASCDKRMYKHVPERVTWMSVKNQNTLNLHVSTLERFCNVKHIKMRCLYVRPPVDLKEFRNAATNAVQFLFSFPKLTHAIFIGQDAHGNLIPWYRSLPRADTAILDLIDALVHQVCFAYRSGRLRKSVMIPHLIPGAARSLNDRQSGYTCLLEGDERPCSMCKNVLNSFPPLALVELEDYQIPCFNLDARLDKVLHDDDDVAAIHSGLVSALDYNVSWRQPGTNKLFSSTPTKEFNKIINSFVLHRANPQNPEIRKDLTESGCRWNKHFGKRVMTNGRLQFLQKLGMELWESDFDILSENSE